MARRRMLASASARSASISASSRCVAAVTARLKELRIIPIKTRSRTEEMWTIMSLGGMAKVVMVLCMLAGVHQASAGCKHCSMVGKEEKAMFRSHSDACMATSKADPGQVDALSRGEFLDTPQLRAHVHCVLMKCKVVGKDGKLQKTALFDKPAVRGNGKDVAKILENCAEHQYGDTPEDRTWNLFRCAYNKKAILFDYMPNAMSTLEV
ncbi:uncharacterized protein LOC134797468 isoform X2 [Cydia splendana]|uniref:uncharacterized protein LOC134797468 isoform X2 n=1 Tax=Cydia splendana TaxID=1100963 RepID=UPI00300CF37C